ncbi:CAP domain-containing protein [Evansella sp. AB-rgal1]|uniref:CAP domain-containing protein n=1 Tax=Evansella sp. AB-rgal1 TaxID=3242696 RepID=UPI00359D16A4
MIRKLSYLHLFTLCFLVLIGCNTDVEETIDDRYIGLNEKGDQVMDVDQGSVNNEDTISSDSTTLSSDNFPHTKAVQIQEAKFEYKIDVNQQNKNVQINQSKKNWNKENQQDQNELPQNEGATQEQQQQADMNQSKAEETDESEPGQDDITAMEQRVIELTNQERRNNGLQDLQFDGELGQVARTKSNDMRENSYFSHTSPTYGSPFDMIRDFGVSYNAAAENIAQGQQTAEQVVESWMNSAGHRQNILNGNYTHIGVGYDPNGHHWTQMFIQR